jgi:drug/metabolite transporter (DMT)-like permease
MQGSRRAPILQALLAAALFGAGAPVAKGLLAHIDPRVLAGLFYLGSGLGAGLLILGRRLRSRRLPADGFHREESAWRRSDIPWIVGASLCGGVAAPILLFQGLRSTPASVGSLLLNLEGAATAVIASVVFRESLGARVWGAVAILTAAGALLAWDPSGGGFGLSAGAALIGLACLLWGSDNNLTRVVSGRDPVVLVALKGSAAGSVSLLLAASAGADWPTIGFIPTAMLLGFICYGLSLALFVHSLRDLGAARTSALFGTAPFLGAGLSLLFLREAVTLRTAGAFLLMAGGAWLLLAERHEHPHEHEELEHDHRHRHDDGHHDHPHPAGECPAGGWHAHPHRHPEHVHAHAHAPDLHHRHPHARAGQSLGSR